MSDSTDKLTECLKGLYEIVHTPTGHVVPSKRVRKIKKG